MVKSLTHTHTHIHGIILIKNISAGNIIISKCFFEYISKYINIF